MPKPIIITCAPTGGIHTPTMSEHLPVTPEEIATASIEAAQAGAAIIHLHARNPRTGRPDPRPELFTDFMSRIKGAPGCCAVWRGFLPYGTTSSGVGRQWPYRLPPRHLGSCARPCAVS